MNSSDLTETLPVLKAQALGDKPEPEDSHWADSPVSSQLAVVKGTVYQVCYDTGAFLLDGSARLGAAAKASATWIGKKLVRKAGQALRLLAESELAHTWRRFYREYSALQVQTRQRKAEGHSITFKEISERAAFVLKYGWKGLRYSLNYLCPAAAIVGLCMTVNYFTSLDFALEVEYDGKNIGYIVDETVFDDAQQMVKERIIYEDYAEPEDTVPKFTLRVVDESQLVDADALSDEIVQASGNEIVSADGLYIDDTFVGATTDGERLLMLLDSYKDTYKEQYPDAKLEFTKKIRIRSGLYPVSSVVELNNMEDYMNTEVESERTYIVEAGDAPILIARANGVSLSSLIELNPEIETTLLPGQELLISKAVPRLGIKATVTETYVEDVPFKIEKENDNTQTVGYTKVIQIGENGTQRVTAATVYENGTRISTDIIESEVLVEPVNQVTVVGTKAPAYSYSSSYSSYTPPLSGGSATSSGYIWPVGYSGSYVSCYLYGYAGHTGMDIAAPSGSPIYATAAGTVEVATQQSGFGKWIVINHGNGLKTRYLHCSALYVTVGQQVNQGQTIAAVGRTGNATGNHLHIEFRQNGAVMNPVNYIGSR